MNLFKGFLLFTAVCIIAGISQLVYQMITMATLVKFAGPGENTAERISNVFMAIQTEIAMVAVLLVILLYGIFIRKDI